jgi:acyl carrier protein
LINVQAQEQPEGVMQRDKIEESIITALKDYMETQDIKDEVDSKTILFGPESALDSMGLVNVVIDVETRFLSQGYTISLTSEKAMSRKNSPFRTVSTLADYIEELINETAG